MISNICQVHLKLMKFPKKEQLVNTQRIVSRLFWEKCKKQISKSKDTYYEYLIHFEIEICKKRKLF